MNAYAQTIDRPPLERAIITVESIINKGPGKPSVIKDTKGLSFGIWPDKTAAVRAGEAYEIEFDMNGAYRNIKKISASTRPGPAPEQFTGGRQQENSAAQPAQQTGNGGGNYYRPTSPQDSKNMFVCKIVGDFIRTGRIECHREAIAYAIAEVGAAYDTTRQAPK